jgi:radical SAM superfamily enzyme YgiQ (UPF0313 family)
MKKPKLLIIVLFQNLGTDSPYYARTPAPPLPGILLAGMTPSIVDVEVLHEMVRPIDYCTDAEFIAISFMDYLASHAYHVSEKFRDLGKVVVGGGKYATSHPDIVESHFDAILIGEAQQCWPQMVFDMVAGRLEKRYTAKPTSCLHDIPPPRYDLVEEDFGVAIVTETSRGCPHLCTYCQLNIDRISYRVRPVEDVIRDLEHTKGLPWHKRKLAMLLDNNLGGDLNHAKKLLREIAKLKFWGIGVQFSFECLRDDEFVALLVQARCRMAFIGMESLHERSLKHVQKRQNRICEYSHAFEKLISCGILVFAGLMIALDEDSNEYYESLPAHLDEVDPSVILPSIAIPIYGTPWYEQVVAEGRLSDNNLCHYDGDHLVFKHRYLTEDEIYEAYRRVNKLFFSWPNIVKRFVRIILKQSKQENLGQFLVKLLIICFVYVKLSLFQKHHAQERVLNFATRKKQC